MKLVGILISFLIITGAIVYLSPLSPLKSDEENNKQNHNNLFPEEATDSAAPVTNYYKKSIDKAKDAANTIQQIEQQQKQQADQVF